MKMNQKGFSLVELMIVVAIIGILATIGVPQYQKFQRKARQTEAKTSLSGLYTSMQTFRAEYNAYFGNFIAIGYGASGDLNYNTGFATAGTAPVHYPGQGISRTNGAVTRLTQDFCAPANAALNQGQCRFVGQVTTGLGPTGSTVALNTFTATSTGSIGGGAGGTGLDRWTIDNRKRIVNTLDGL